MVNLPKVKKVVRLLKKKYPDVNFTGYKQKKPKGVFWYIAINDHDTYFDHDYKKHIRLMRRIHLKDVKIAFCFIPDFEKFSLKQEELDIKLYVLKTD